mmetsp:Transcript_22070/g.77370  ORF Transcript_22070/g.77370 Transcript_22070/m.77370 type:complete len:211 (+) Transcript_22070:737-1369(+)
MMSTSTNRLTESLSMNLESLPRHVVGSASRKSSSVWSGFVMASSVLAHAVDDFLPCASSWACTSTSWRAFIAARPAASSRGLYIKLALIRPQHDLDASSASASRADTGGRCTWPVSSPRPSKPASSSTSVTGCFPAPFGATFGMMTEEGKNAHLVRSDRRLTRVHRVAAGQRRPHHKSVGRATPLPANVAAAPAPLHLPRPPPAIHPKHN